MALPTSVRRLHTHGDFLPIISITAPPDPKPAREKHIVAIVGPRMERVASCLVGHCHRLGLSLRMVHTDSDDFNASTMDELHASGALGPVSQLVVLGHGSNQSTSHGIETQCHGPGPDGESHHRTDDTLTLLKWLRLGQDTDPMTGERLPWKGMAHVLSCGAHILAELIARSDDAQEYGPNLIYGNLDSHSLSETSEAIRSICEFMHHHRAEATLPPTALLAWVGKTAAVPVTLIGGEVRSPIVLQPAQSVVEAMPAFLAGRLRQLQAERSHDAAAAVADLDSLRRAAEAMRREDVRPDSLLLQENLSRIVHEQALNGQPDTLAELLDDAPPLADVPNAFGRPLDAVVVSDRRHRHEKSTRKVGENGRPAGKPAPVPTQESLKVRTSSVRGRFGMATRGKEAMVPGRVSPGIGGRARIADVNGRPGDRRSERAAVLSSDERAREEQVPQDRLLAAAVRRIVQEPGHAAVLLQRACAQGDIGMFAALYRAAGLAPFRDPALIRSCSNQAMPPLHLACLIGAPELAATLLENRADVNQADRNGRTALHHAVGARSLALIRVLAAANADATIRSQGITAVELAAQSGFDAGFAELATSGFWQSQKAGGKSLSARRAGRAPDS